MNRQVSVVIVAVIFMVGCVHTSRTETLADINVATPPPQMEQPERMLPVDEATYWTGAVMVRPFWEIGRAEQGDGDGRGRQHNWGAEVLLGAGRSSRPDEATLLGIGTGCSPCRTGSSGLRRHYVEAHGGFIFFEETGVVPFIARASAGWSYHPETGDHGPQITFGNGEIIHFRWYRHFGQSSSFLLGVSIPAGVVMNRRR